MGSLVLQYGVRNGRVAEIAKSQQGVLSVGRGYDNNLVLTDAHVAPQQLKLQWNGNDWTLIVLDDTNPVLLNGEPVSPASSTQRGIATVRSGDRLVVGRTAMTAYLPDHVLAPTRTLLLSGFLRRRLASVWMAFAILLLVCGLHVLGAYYLAATDLKWQNSLLLGVFSGVFYLFWAGLWSLAGRVLHHHSHFALQLIATCAVLLLWSVLDIASLVLEYTTHQLLLVELIDYAVVFFFVAILLRLNFTFATSIERPGRLAAVVSAVLVVSIFGIQYLVQKNDFSTEPVYSRLLLPPVLDVIDGESIDAYLRRID